MAQESESSEVDGTSEPETWSDSDCSSDIHDFWDRIMDDRIDRIGRAPSPRRYSSAVTSSIKALDEEKQILKDAMEAIRYRCANEEMALQGILDDLREHLEYERRVIARSIAAIHNHRNLLMPVMRLPPEILSRIFVFHAQMEDNWLDAALKSTHVCKQWWDIGRGCPELWSHIKSEDCRSAAWMARMIERSCSLPLSFAIGSRDETEAGARKLALVVDNMHRFESLDVRVPRAEAQYGPFFEAFSPPAPLLRHLKVCNYGNSTFAFPPKFLGGSAPNLRHMMLATSCHVPWNSALFAHLTTLDVSGPEYEFYRPNPPSLRMLLSALMRMPGLETLILRHRVPPPSMIEYPHVDLSNLKRLEVVASLVHCTSFLRHITINPDATVLLGPECSDVASEDVEEFLTFFPSHLHTTSPPSAQALKFTWDYRDFKVDVWTVQQDTEVKIPGSASIKLVISWHSDRLEITPLDLTWACFAALASPQLQSFRISGDPIVGWDAEVWRKLADVAPDIRMLAPGGTTQSVELCKALSPPDRPGLVPADCCLPVLSCLELDIHDDHPMPTPDGGESPLSVVLARSFAARASIGCLTPDLEFFEPRRGDPQGWLESLMDAVPGIGLYMRRRSGEEFMEW